MKKIGFTLAELLISLTVVGVIAAITAPLLGNIMPDKNKVQVLKYHKVITDITRELLEDPGIYWQPAGSNCVGLDCGQQPLAEPYNTEYFAGATKYARLLVANLEGESSDTYITLPNGVQGGSAGQKIQLADGTLISVGTPLGVIGSTHAERTIFVSLDINGEDSPNCSYSSSNCKSPDRFTFEVDMNGQVLGGDSLTKAYLANPYKLNDRKADLKAAASMK